MLPLPFANYFSGRKSVLSHNERERITSLRKRVESEFSSKKYVLGLCIDFALLSQVLSNHRESVRNFDPGRDEKVLFRDFPRKTHNGAKELNSLTVELSGKVVGIRKFEEEVKSYFHSKGYMSYPSAYVYNTGQWHKFTDLLGGVFSLSESGRETLISELIAFATQNLKQASVRVSEPYAGPTITQIFEEYPMSANGENAGLTFQAICYAICRVLYPHLFINAASVRTGSRRQSRIGDIDLYAGDALAVTAEVKDLDLSVQNADKQVSQFHGDVKDLSVIALIFCRSATEEVRNAYTPVIFLDYEWVHRNSATWDPGMYDIFLSSILFYLSQIECSESARSRFESYTATFREV